MEVSSQLIRSDLFLGVVLAVVWLDVLDILDHDIIFVHDPQDFLMIDYQPDSALNTSVMRR